MSGLGRAVVANGIKGLVPMYDAFIIDQWGVLHDGRSAYTGAIECMKKLRESNKKIVILSNSSRRKENTLRGMDKVGFDNSLYDEVVTSGEMGWSMLANNKVPYLNLNPNNRKAFVFGNGDCDEEYIKSMGYEFAPVETAECIVARGTFSILDSNTEVKSYKSADKLISDSYSILQIAAKRNIPMIVTNPDMTRPGARYRGNSPMPGYLGEKYTSLGGKVHYIGKPYPDVYTECFEIINKLSGSKVDPSRICGIGDSLLNDVKGAERAGISSIWTSNGVHADELLTTEGSNVLAKERKLSEVMTIYNVVPTHIVPCFNW